MRSTFWMTICATCALVAGPLLGHGGAWAGETGGIQNAPGQEKGDKKEEKGKGGDAKEGGDKKDAEKKDAEKKDVEKKDGEKKDAATVEAVKHPALSFVMKNIDGADQDLKQYYGKVLLFVNTASECGYTPQYADLKKLHNNYAAQGFSVLGFPSNSFKQEPASNEDVKKFCREKFDFSFPLFAKVSVKGADICPLYKYLTAGEHAFKGEIEWNFTKFLINRKGEVIGRFKQTVHPLKDKKLIAAIEAALAEPAPTDSQAEDEPVQLKPSTKLRTKPR